MQAFRTALVSSLVLAAAAARAQDPARELVVRVDPRVELLSIVFRLAGNPEYQGGKVDRYTQAVESHFGEDRDHAVVRLAADLRRRRGVSYDAVMGMAVHLRDTEKLKEVLPFSPQPESLDSRWKSSDARRFVRELRKFVDKTGFNEFFASQEDLFATTVERMRARMRESADLEWFDEFFGARPSASFQLSLGMLNGGACYGPHVTYRDGAEELHCVLGVWATDDDGLPVFDEDVVATVVHEFCHSYCNRLVDQHLDALEKPAAKLWPHVEEAMRGQAYGNPATMLRESLVRACVIRYQAATRGTAAHDEAVRAEARRQFLWAGELSDVLVEYEESRGDHPTLAEFMPRVVEFFGEYADGLEERLAKFPRVVEMVPENGTQDVSPKLREIVITFDRPMADGSWSFVGGGPKYPKTTGRPRYDSKCTVIRLPVELEPDHEYEFWLNRGKYDSFRSADGVALQPVRVTFKTRKR